MASKRKAKSAKKASASVSKEPPPLKAGYERCPYNPNHTVPAKRLTWHVVGCPDKQTRGHLFETCPYSASHIILKEQLAEHKKNCPDKPANENDQQLKQLTIKRQSIDQSVEADEYAGLDFPAGPPRELIKKESIIFPAKIHRKRAADFFDLVTPSEKQEPTVRRMASSGAVLSTTEQIRKKSTGRA